MKRADEMRERINRWQAAGGSLRAFGRREGVSYSKLVYWRRRFESEDQEGQQSPELMPVQVTSVVSDPADSTKFEVWLPNGLAVDVGAGFDESELRRLVGVLRSC
jgi:hypothetical protein